MAVVGKQESSGGGGGGDRDRLSSANAGADAADLDDEKARRRASTTTTTPQQQRRLMRKLYLHTVPIACLITTATFIDRANLALAAPVLLHDIGLTRAQFGLASAVMFVTYGLCMWVSALMFTVISLRAWFGTIVSAWGACTALMALIGLPGISRGASFGVLIFLRLALGAAEAGTMPGCFFLLSRFLPKRELAYAYSWVSERERENE